LALLALWQCQKHLNVKGKEQSAQVFHPQEKPKIDHLLSETVRYYGLKSVATASSHPCFDETSKDTCLFIQLFLLIGTLYNAVHYAVEKPPNTAGTTTSKK